MTRNRGSRSTARRNEDQTPVDAMPSRLLFTLVIAVATTAGAASPPIVIEGNHVLPDEVYLAVLDLDARASGVSDERDPAAMAAYLAERVRAFLLNAGYEIATVRGEARGEQIVLIVDEGRLAKIVFKGLGTLRTLQLKVQLNIPYRVYNRPQIMRQLDAICAEYGIDEADVKLVPTKEIEHVGYQVEKLDIQGFATIPPPGDYELHIRLGRQEWRGGLQLHAKYDGTDGLRLGTSYAGGGVVFDDDRWSVRADAAGRSFPEPDRSDGPFRLSRAVIGGRAYTPEIGASGLRPFISLYGDLRVRPRFDLGLERYAWLAFGAQLSMGYQFLEGMHASVGGGAERRHLTGLQRIEIDTGLEPVQEAVQNRWLILLAVDLLFDTKQLRLDRRHKLHWELRTYFADLDRFLWLSRGKYQRVFELGWHDLWIRASGAALWGQGGQVPFVEEEPVSRHVRGVFNDEYWVRSIAAVSAEFRYSLSRDLYKLSAFTDAAIFEDPGPTRRGRRRLVAASVGLGFHALVLDVAQIDFYVAYGTVTDGNRDFGVSARAAKAF